MKICYISRQIIPGHLLLCHSASQCEEAFKSSLYVHIDRCRCDIDKDTYILHLEFGIYSLHINNVNYEINLYGFDVVYRLHAVFKLCDAFLKSVLFPLGKRFVKTVSD